MKDAINVRPADPVEDEALAPPAAPSPAARVAAILMSGGTGLFCVAVAIGAVPLDPAAVRVPMWLLGEIGVLLLVAAFMAKVQPTWQSTLAYDVLGATLMTLFVTPFAWIAFGPGRRVFSGPGLLRIFGVSGEVEGRIAFGTVVVVFGGITLFAWRHVLRRLWLGDWRRV